MTAVAQPAHPALPKKKPRFSKLERREIKWGLIFLSPWIVGFTVFTLFPMIASLIFSVTQFNLLQPQDFKFIGLANYQRLFTDPQVWQSLMITLRFALFSVPLAIFLPLGLALLVNAKNLFGKNVFRALFFMPQMISAVAIVVVFGGVLNSQSGWINRILAFFGIQGPNWFQDEVWVVPALALMTVWTVGNTMIVMLAGLQNVPTELYEAARVDGSSPWNSFRNITMPMISPVIFYNLILAVVGSLQYLVGAFIIGNGRGDPNGATMFYNMYLYKEAFGYLDMGYAATLAWVLFFIGLGLTLLLFRLQRRWVYYATGD
ncbi:MAG TPA: sugar ABC transporter permease [Anaerolineae bacterium]|nr:sugar ABC transporter permease [Anaerolineae bacterium]